MHPAVNQPPFNLATHQRQRIRALEQANSGLERTNQKLLRLLALAVTVAAGKDCDPLTLLAVLEDIDRVNEQARIADSIFDRFAEVERGRQAA